MAAVYDLIEDYVGETRAPLAPLDDIATELSVSPHWALCVVRLGLPLSYSRKTGKSVTNDFSQGVHLRGENLIIVSDCTSLQISGSKDQHTKSLAAELKQTDHNYLTEILPGDWVLAWIVNDGSTMDDLLSRIRAADPKKPCNGFNDGLKFVGRVDSIRKRQHVDRGSGIRTISVTLSAVGFRELDSMFFYDHNLGENDIEANNLSTWLAKLGLDLETLFAVDMNDGQKNNAQKLITALIDLLVGKGVSSNINPTGNNALRAGTGAGTSDTDAEAPFAYLVPRVVGALLGQTNTSKKGGILAYADILATQMGVQSYPCNAPTPFDTKEDARRAMTFLPDFDVALSTTSGASRLVTKDELLGTYIPLMPDFDNRPLWNVLQQFLNPTVNEMYTCMRANVQGLIMPTLVTRQIPFTTEAFNDTITSNAVETGSVGPSGPTVKVKATKFLSLPRWKLHGAMISDVDIGRSDATRFNFIHVYGQDANSAHQISITEQLVQNPPARDDLDIQRSGLRAFMTTIACATRDQVGKAPAVWINLVADRLIGSQYTLNGTIQSIGIQAPICEGDNIEWDGVVYQIEMKSDHCGIDVSGRRTFTTLLTVTNGMRADGNSDVGKTGGGGENSAPIYPGLRADDNRATEPGIDFEDKYDRTKAPVDKSDLDPDNK